MDYQKQLAALRREFEKAMKVALARIEELEKWKAAKTRQQISYPLDQASRNVINETV